MNRTEKNMKPEMKKPVEMYDFLFEFTEESDYEGEQILCEESSLENAWRCLIEDNGFSRSELKFMETLPVEVGEALGLDTY